MYNFNLKNCTSFCKFLVFFKVWTADLQILRQMTYNVLPYPMWNILHQNVLHLELSILLMHGFIMLFIWFWISSGAYKTWLAVQNNFSTPRYNAWQCRKKYLPSSAIIIELWEEGLVASFRPPSLPITSFASNVNE